MRYLFPSRTVLFLLFTAVLLPAQEAKPPAQTNPAAPAKAEAVKPAMGAESATPVAVDPKSYMLGPEDVVFVRVWREPDLSGPEAVRPDGMITMPLIGDVQAGGSTPEQLGQRIAEKLTKYINQPQVIVSVTQVKSKRYYVTGEVNKSGAFPLAVPTTVLQALTEAGPFRDFANVKNITILRGSRKFRFNYKEVIKGKNLDQNIQLENGDYIIVP